MASHKFKDSKTKRKAKVAQTIDYAARYDKHLAVVKIADAKKPLLVRLRYGKGQYFGIIQNQFALQQPDELPLHSNEVLCVFPNEKQEYGRVYGVNVEPLIANINVPKWGRIALFRELTDTEYNMLIKGLNITYKKFIRKHQLKYLLPINLEIRNPEGQTSGKYIRTKDGDPTIVLLPKSFVTELKNKLILRIMSHELAHQIFDLFLSPVFKAKWIKAYKNINKVRQYNSTELQTQLRELLDSRTVVSEYRKQLKDDERLFFDCSLKWIKDTHHIDVKSLDTLCDTNDPLLAELWPQSKLHMANIMVVLTKYANKNPMEFYCEAISLYAIGEDMPKSISKLCVDTLASVKPK